LHAFQQDYAAELARLNRQNDSLRPDYEREHGEVSAKLANLKAAVLKGVAPLRFVEEMNQLQGRQRYLGAELATRATPPDATSIVLRADLAHIYRAKFGALTAIFEDDALRAEVFRREKPPAVCTEGVLQIKLVAG